MNNQNLKNGKTNNKKSNTGNNLIVILLSILLCLLIGVLLKYINIFMTSNIEKIKKIQINKLQKEYVEPFLKENLEMSNYEIEFKRQGKCKTYVCSEDIWCGRLCCQDKYVKSGCKAYTYRITNNGNTFLITVFNYKNKYQVIEGEEVTNYIDSETK